MVNTVVEIYFQCRPTLYWLSLIEMTNGIRKIDSRIINILSAFYSPCGQFDLRFNTGFCCRFAAVTNYLACHPRILYSSKWWGLIKISFCVVIILISSTVCSPSSTPPNEPHSITLVLLSAALVHHYVIYSATDPYCGQELKKLQPQISCHW